MLLMPGTYDMPIVSIPVSHNFEEEMEKKETSM